MQAVLFKKAPDASTVTKIWILFVLLSIGVFLLFVGKTYYTFDAFGIWLLSCIALIYLSKQKIDYLEEKQKNIIIIIGVGICILSFACIPLGISKPPYSIGEYSVLLSGIGLILFAALKLKSLLLPVVIPCIAIIGYDVYLLFLEYADHVIGPLIPFTASISTLLMNAIGIQAMTDGENITLFSQNGVPVYLKIVGECTGIVSLGTFTIAVIIVLTTFPQSITRKNIGIITIGYFGTYCANIGRIILIALSGYFYGPQGAIEQVHIHIGWLLFSLWMIIFWYFFFTRQLGFSIFKNQRSIE